MDMIRNYLATAIRNLLKRKLYSFINGFGLSIAIAFCLLIWLFVNDEMSFDQFHANKDNIYRINVASYNYWDPKLAESERWRSQAYLQTPVRDAMKDEIPEVVYATRFNSSTFNAWGNSIISYRDRVFSENIVYVDQDFFRMFSFRILRGDSATIFNDRHEIVITPAIARKYFGDEDPIGKTIDFDNGEKSSLVVTGVIEAPPANSSINFAILIPQENRRNYEQAMESWANFNSPCFVQLRPDADLAIFGIKLAGVRDKYMGEVLKGWRNRSSLPESQSILEYTYSSLNDIHLESRISWDKVSDRQYSYILGGIALLILLIASINYISLALTTSVARRTEVGIRKVVGAIRKQLFYQFGLESMMLAVLSMVTGFGLMALFLPAFNSFTQKGISLMNTDLFSLLLIGLMIALVIGFIAGCYPALFLSKFKPIAVLRGRSTGKLRAGFTKPLVVLQFAMSAFLIVSSVIMYRQMKFVSTKDLGYNKDAIVVINNQVPWETGVEKVFDLFRNELRRIPSVESIAGTSFAFGDGYNNSGYEVDGVNHSTVTYVIDPEFIRTLGIRFVSGRNFDESIASDSMAIIVNEALVRDLGWKNTDDVYLNWKGDPASKGYKVIGVVKDFHFRSLESDIEPMLFLLPGKYDHITRTLVKMSGDDIPGTVAAVGSTWRQLFPGRPFDLKFFDDTIAKQYQQHEQRMNIITASTTFAVLISCLGLFGLAGINAVNRTREIGIRKVMGADLKNIFMLLNTQYVWLSLTSFAIAIPFSWYVMDKWLSGFKFHITLGWDIFAASVACGIFVAILTVAYHSIKAGMVNPADTLRSE